MKAATGTVNALGFPTVPCDRCQGRAIMNEFAHVAAGECFKCGGEGYTVKAGKVARAYAAYKEAVKAAQLGTSADIVAGTKFVFGTQWVTALEAPVATKTGVAVKSSHGLLTFPADMAIRIHRPETTVDVNEYLKGL